MSPSAPARKPVGDVQAPRAEAGDGDLGGLLDDETPPLRHATSPSALVQPPSGRGRRRHEAAPPQLGDDAAHS